jgi:diguanylate cyclase (GGDEF)-like protein
MQAHPGTWFDEQTGLPARSFWDVILRAESSRCSRWSRSATVVLVAIAGLDDVIAQWGTEMLDRPMTDLSRILRSGCRASDYVTRLDASRFGVLLTETDEIAAINVVERLRAKADRDVGARLSQGRICFGWASPKGKSTLLEAVGSAEERLAQEAAEANEASKVGEVAATAATAETAETSEFGEAGEG